MKRSENRKRVLAGGLASVMLGLVGAMCVQPVSAGSTQWTTWRGDSTLCGVAAGALETPAEIRWKAKLGSAVKTTPVVAGGFVYALTAGGQVVKLDGRDGRVLWVRPVSPTVTATNSPASSDEFAAPLLLSQSIVVCATMRGKVYAMETETGDRRWSYDAGGAIQGTPVSVEGVSGAAAGIVVLVQAEGMLHCLDSRTGALRWNGGGFGRADGHPAAQGERVIIGGCDASIHVVRGVGTGVVNVATIAAGEGNEIAGGVAVSGSNVYHGSRSGFLFSGDIETQKHCWKTKLDGGELQTTPAVTEFAVICTTGNGMVSAVDRKTGVVKWTYDSRGDRVSSPIVIGDKVVCCVDGKIVVVRLSDGSQVWRSKDVGGELTAPAFGDGYIVVGTDDGMVVALGSKPPTGKGL